MHTQNTRRRRATRPAGTPDRAASAPVATMQEPSAEPAAIASASPAGSTTFAELGVPAAVLRELHSQGMTDAFPIQSATLPDTLAGRDVLGRGRTGSGKTLAFSIPMVARLAAAARQRQPKRPRGLVLVPTRELANQVRAVLEPLAKATGLRTAVVFGGVGQGPQATALKNGIDVLIACPGRLEDLIGQGLCNLDAVEITVLDEADHMADLGFLPGVKRLLDTTPARGQRMLFSATLDNGVDVLVRRYLDAPLTHSVDSAAAAPTAMTHHLLNVSAADKNSVVRELASGTGRSLLFTRTKHGAKRLARQLTAAGIPTVELHGNLSQGARERNLAAFTSGQVRVLAATDIAARGIHVDEVELVVHVDPPAEHKAYLHRSGRTARAGADGVVVTLVTPEQQRDVSTLVRQAKIKPTTASVRPGAEEVRQLAGETAALVKPEPAPVRSAPQAPQRSAPQRSRSGSSRRGGRARGRGRSRAA
ncbi:MAG TPA: DEAD/DEAH box helicase [Nocardioidaceae bacterium]|nr:DEAD/DEAH box helicase [Nocardioidaceae bacterium]